MELQVCCFPDQSLSCPGEVQQDELATGHGYHQKLALFGESVLFKKIVKFKGNNIFERGVWAGKHPWNDTHVILTPEGAFESRTIRRLAVGENFIATDIVFFQGASMELFSSRHSDATCWTDSARTTAYT